MARDILIVDDEDDIRDLIAGILEDEGYETRQAHDADSALNEVARRRPSLIYLDIWMQGSRLDGLQLLDVLQTQHPEVPVVMISGHGNVETAVSAIRRGAYDYIEKPFKIDRLLLITQGLGRCDGDQLADLRAGFDTKILLQFVDLFRCDAGVEKPPVWNVVRVNNRSCWSWRWKDGEHEADHLGRSFIDVQRNSRSTVRRASRETNVASACW